MFRVSGLPTIKTPSFLTTVTEVIFLQTIILKYLYKDITNENCKLLKWLKYIIIKKLKTNDEGQIN